jgi:succinate dehydrogenase/fumarate reductase flavoprotein subunit
MKPILSTFGDTQIHVTDHPTSSDHAAILKTLRAFTIDTVPVLDNHDFAALITDPEGEVIGGLVATSQYERQAITHNPRMFCMSGVGLSIFLDLRT